MLMPFSHFRYRAFHSSHVAMNSVIRWSLTCCGVWFWHFNDKFWPEQNQMIWLNGARALLIRRFYFSRLGHTLHHALGKWIYHACIWSIVDDVKYIDSPSERAHGILRYDFRTHDPISYKCIFTMIRKQQIHRNTTILHTHRHTFRLFCLQVFP